MLAFILLSRYRFTSHIHRKTFRFREIHDSTVCR